MVVKNNSDIATCARSARRRRRHEVFRIQGREGVVASRSVCLRIIGALNVAAIVGFVEYVFGFKFLPVDVYQIADLPSELRYMDVVMTAVVSFTLSALATIYPSWRASKVNPAEALRYE